jgi:adenosylcobinamide-phosphate guanylyltransferase
MTVTGLIMAGGKGTRMATEFEKPLLEINGKPMIHYVIDAVRGSRKIEDVVIAISKHTPKTAENLRSLGFHVIETPGNGYIEDTKTAVKLLGLAKTLVISADIPLVTSDFIDEVIHRYEASGKPALVVTCRESLKRLVHSSSQPFEHEKTRLIPLGVNVLDGKRIDEKELDEEIMVTERLEAALNVNTPEDLELARSFIAQVKPDRRSELGRCNIISRKGESEEIS